eukprot:TRINITY_DN10959_c0_g1_i1.p1 TRINITY_DN10959_c0_g1~~TRINITY_DN10959_c0_g1_i1.p1  ORF type:complete len:1367 (+),score=427.47 TRINITY_DN10959_c0_g1_i1:70-4101(+)
MAEMAQQAAARQPSQGRRGRQAPEPVSATSPTASERTRSERMGSPVATAFPPTPAAVSGEPPAPGTLQVKVLEPVPHQASGFVDYPLQLLSRDGQELHRCNRRFTDFQQMVVRLEQRQRQEGGKPPPADTPRVHNPLAGKFNQEWLEERRLQLQTYLDKVWKREDLVNAPEVLHLVGYDEWCREWANSTITRVEAEWGDHSRQSLTLLQRTEQEAARRMATMIASAQYGNFAVTLGHLRCVLAAARAQRPTERLRERLPLRFAEVTKFASDSYLLLQRKDVTLLDLSPVESRLRAFQERQGRLRQEVARHAATVGDSFGAPLSPRGDYHSELRPLIAARDDASEAAIDGAVAFRETVQSQGVSDWLAAATAELMPRAQCELAMLSDSWPPPPAAPPEPLDTPGDNLFGLYSQAETTRWGEDPSVSGAQRFDAVAVARGVADALAELDQFLSDEDAAAERLMDETEAQAANATKAIQKAAGVLQGVLEPAAEDDGLPPDVAEAPEQLRLVEVAADREMLHLRRFTERCGATLPGPLRRALEGLTALLRWQIVCSTVLLDRSEHFATLAGQNPAGGSAAQRAVSGLMQAEQQTERIKVDFLDAQDKDRRARTLTAGKGRDQAREAARQALKAARERLQDSLAEEQHLRRELEGHAAALPEVLSLYPVLAAERTNQRFQLDFFDLENKLHRGRHVILRTSFSGRKVALKEFNIFSPSAKETFDREAHRLAGMQHPHIIPIEAVIHEPDTQKSYILMPYYEAGNLERWLQGHPSLDDRVAVCIQVLLALFHLHRQGVIHGGVKLENVLVATVDDGIRAVLADYDVARANERRQPYSNPDSPIPSFTAPECSDPQCFAGSEADMWAFGCLMMLALAGRMEFINADDGCLVNLHDLESLQGELEREQIEHVRDMLQSLLQAAPEKRLTSLAALQHPFFESFDSNEVTVRKLVANQARELLQVRQEFDCRTWDPAVAAAKSQRSVLQQATSVRAAAGERAASLADSKAACQVDEVLDRAAVDEECRRCEAGAPALDAEDARCEETAQQLRARFSDVQRQAAAVVEQGLQVWKQACDTVRGRTPFLPYDWVSDARVPQMTPRDADGPAAQSLRRLLPGRLRLQRLQRHEDGAAWARYQERRDAIRLLRGVQQLPQLPCASDEIAVDALAAPLDGPLNEKLLFLTLPFNPLPCDDLSCFAQDTPLGHGLLLTETPKIDAATVGSGGSVAVLAVRVVLGRPCVDGRVEFYTQPTPPSPWAAAPLVPPYAVPTCSQFDSVVAMDSAVVEPPAGSPLAGSMTDSPAGALGSFGGSAPPSPSFATTSAVQPTRVYLINGRRGCYYVDALLECSTMR